MTPEIEKSLSRLDQKLEVLFAELDNLPDKVLLKPEREGKWSINQVLVHLLTTERGTYRYLQKKMLGDGPFKKENILARIRYYALIFALRMPIKFKMPKQLKDPFNDRSYKEVRSDYLQVRKELREFLAKFPTDMIGKQIFKHPFAGRFSLPQTIDFLNFHFDHHLFQINRIKRRVGIGQ